MKALLETYAEAVTARVKADKEPDPCGARLKAAAREAAALEALEVAIATAAAHMGEITGLADDIRLDTRIMRATDPTIAANGWQADWSRVGVDRYRKPTLKDAKRNAELIAKRARQAWDLLDPSIKPTKANP